MEKESNNTLPFLDVLISRTEQGFKTSVYRKPTFTGQYLNVNSHHPHSVKKGIVRCLQHRAKVISGDPETLDKELVSISSTLQPNNFSGYMAAAPQNWDRRIQEKEEVKNTQKTVCLPYVKGLSEKIQRICGPYNIRTTFKSLTTLRRYLPSNPGKKAMITAKLQYEHW